MEISKGLQEEILSVQNKLENAIRDHQICVGKLKDDPKNADILGQIQEIQLHIVSLGRCQKQVVQRLRKEVETFKAENKNGAKVSVASLLGLNNNNHITNNNEAGNDVSDVKDLNGLGRRSSKDDYEEVVEGGDVAPSPPRHNERPKERSCSVETISGEDDVIEVSVDENSCEKREEDDVEEMEGEEGVIVDVEPCVIEPFQQLNFLGNLGLITTEKCTELQNKRAERKRRSTANPQFVYSNWEIPTKRKRHSYLQSAGNAPQTRQTTARLNGPSPPPGKVSSKTSSPSSRALTKSLIPTQKTTSRPNILRNAIESKVFVGKGKLDNGAGQTQLPSAKSVQSVGSKAVHIPGLPSSLTIERIENDTSVCISCRNPGTLAICERCSANYHISCHTISSPPPKTCPKCALRARSLEGGSPIGVQVKKDEELEERERERYELRERNSDLRLQVYELEKRSQLLGQSLQLQHRTRQELLGKQEKTQRSIKRLVDFIKLMQHKRDPISPQPSASTSFLPRPSSSRSPRTPSPPAASANQKAQPSSLTPQAPKLSRHQKAASTTPPSSSTSCQSRTSPTLRQSPKCPTPTNCQSAASSRRNTSHISSSKKWEILPTAKESTTNQRQSPLAISRKVKTLPSSINNSQQHHPGTALVANRRSQSPVPPSCSAVSPTHSAASVKSPTTAQSPDSTESPIRKSSYQSCPPQTTSWNHQQHTTAENRKAGNRHAQISVSPAPQGTRKRSCLPVSSSSVQTPTDWRVGSESSRKKSAAPLRKTDQDRQIYSTRCSPAITSPISSPVVLTNSKTPPRANKIAQNPNNCLGTASPSSTSQLSFLQTQSDLEVPQPQHSPNT